MAVQQPIHDADSEVTGTPGSVTAENGGDPEKEGGLDAGHTEAAMVPGTNIHAEMPAFTSDPIGGSDAIGERESGIENQGESQVHVSDFSGSESGGAEIQNESGDASVQTQMPEAHDTGTDIPQFGAGMRDSIHNADHDSASEKEGGLDAGHTEAAIVPGTNIHAEMPAFTSDPIRASDAIGERESGIENQGESQVHVSDFSGSESGGAEIQNESGDASVQTQMPEAHDTGTDIPQFGAGMRDSIHNADKDSASEADSIHTGHEDQHSPSHSNAAGFSGGSSFGGYAEAPLVAATFPDAEEGTMLRTVGEGMIEASSPDGGNTLWYNSAFYQEPDAPHTVMEAANGVQWYAMQQQAQAPQFESGAEAAQYNQAAFRSFMPGYDGQVSLVDGRHRQDGHFEVRNADGSGTAFYDTARYAAPRGDYQVMEDSRGNSWYAIRGEAAVDRKPVFENGHAVYDDGKLRTVSVETVRYRQTPARFVEPKKRTDIDRKPPRRKT